MKPNSPQLNASFTPVILAGVAWFAVLLQLWLSIQLGFANNKSLIDGLVVFFGYFTVLTNIFVALVGTAGTLNKATNLYRASVVGCATTAILDVGIGYHLLLREIWSPQGFQLLADILLHYVVPICTLLHWLTYHHHKRLAAWLPLVWCLYPIAYLVYALVRGEILGVYPYPFMDVTSLEYQRVLANAFGLLVLFIGLGFAVVSIANLLPRTSHNEVEV